MYSIKKSDRGILVETRAGAIKRGLETVWERICIRFGNLPGCKWVRLSLPAYELWDPSLTPRQFMAIDLHIRKCPQCAEECDNIRMVSGVLQAHAKELNPEKCLSVIDHKALVVKAWNRYVELEAEGAIRRAWAVAIAKKALISAAAFIAILGGLILSYSGGGSASESARVVPATATVSWNGGPEEPTQLAQTRASDRAGRVDQDTLAEGHSLLFESINKVSDKKALRALIESTMPHTEEEYEAWAREQYPHLLWLYDILTNAKSGLAWESGKIERYGESAESRQRFTAASRGWRKLLIDSGELFKFDYPDGPEKPNCIPSIKGLQAAAAVAGYELELAQDGTWPLPQLSYAEGGLRTNRINLHRVDTRTPFALVNSEMAADYPKTLSKNVALARSILNYLCVSARLANLDALESLNNQAFDACVMVARADNCTGGDTNQWRNTFSGVFQTRAGALALMNSRLRSEIASLSETTFTACSMNPWLNTHYPACNVSIRVIKNG